MYLCEILGGRFWRSADGHYGRDRDVEDGLCERRFGGYGMRSCCGSQSHQRERNAAGREIRLTRRRSTARRWRGFDGRLVLLFRRRPARFFTSLSLLLGNFAVHLRRWSFGRSGLLVLI